MRNAKLCQESDCIWPSTPEYAKIAHNKIEMALWSRQVECHQQSPGHWWPPASDRLLRLLSTTGCFLCCLYMSTAWISMCFSWVLGSFKLQFNSTQKYQHPERKRMKNTCHRWSCDLAEFQTSTSYVRPPGEPSWAIHEVQWGDTLLASS